jgi:N-acetylglucosaminyl-diphospho-decaprenol L-rhamnosyltransferase
VLAAEIRHEPDAALTPARTADCCLMVVTFNSGRDIEGLLDSRALAAPGKALWTIVVDNASLDDTRIRASAYGDVTVINAGENLGYAGGINLGRAAVPNGCPILVVNPDVRLGDGCITRLLDALEDRSVGVAVPMIIDEDGSTYPSLHREPSILRALGDAALGSRLPGRPSWLSETLLERDSYSAAVDVDWASGAALMISPACDAAVGEWDADIFFLYSEETDFAVRARNAGLVVRYVPDARVQHRGGGSGSSAALSALMAVNRIRYVRKHHGRLWSAFYRGIVAAHELVRIWKPAHRLALRHVLHSGSWNTLPGRRTSGEPR